MRRPYLLVLGACFLYAVAWFLPVVKDGVTFPHGLPGWEAFRVAACAVWPYEDFRFDNLHVAVLSTTSAVTTLLFIPASVWAVSRGSRALRRVSGWVAISAFIVNAHWCFLFGSDLRIGYFLWWLSFLFMGLALLDLSRRKADNQTTTVPLLHASGEPRRS